MAEAVRRSGLVDKVRAGRGKVLVVLRGLGVVRVAVLLLGKTGRRSAQLLWTERRNYPLMSRGSRSIWKSSRSSNVLEMSGLIVPIGQIVLRARSQEGTTSHSVPALKAQTVLRSHSARIPAGRLLMAQARQDLARVALHRLGHRLTGGPRIDQTALPTTSRGPSVPHPCVPEQVVELRAVLRRVIAPSVRVPTGRRAGTGRFVPGQEVRIPNRALAAGSHSALVPIARRRAPSHFALTQEGRQRGVRARIVQHLVVPIRHVPLRHGQIKRGQTDLDPVWLAQVSSNLSPRAPELRGQVRLDLGHRALVSREQDFPDPEL